MAVIDTTTGGVALDNYVAHDEVFALVLVEVWCGLVASLKNSVDDLVFVMRVNRLYQRLNDFADIDICIAIVVMKKE